MFDVEYGDRIAEQPVFSQPKVNVTIPRSVLQQLARDAKKGAGNAVLAWQKKEETELANKFFIDSKTVLARIFSLGWSNELTHEQALIRAKECINDYSLHQRCWRADEALQMASHWLAITEKVSYIEMFDLPVSAFESMRDWAANS